MSDNGGNTEPNINVTNATETSAAFNAVYQASAAVLTDPPTTSAAAIAHAIEIQATCGTLATIAMMGMAPVTDFISLVGVTAMAQLASATCGALAPVAGAAASAAVNNLAQDLAQVGPALGSLGAIPGVDFSGMPMIGFDIQLAMDHGQISTATSYGGTLQDAMERVNITGFDGLSGAGAGLGIDSAGNVDGW